MKFFLSIVFVLLTKLLSAQSSSTPDSSYERLIKSMNPKAYAQIGHSYPKFSFKVNEKIISNEMLKGKVIFINFWFEGCHPCIAEMDALNELFDTLKNRNDFMFLSFSKDDVETVKRVQQKFKLKYDVISATDQECMRLNLDSGYPTSIIIDKAGIMKFYHTGGPIDKEKARQRVIGILLPEIQSLL